ncbi:pyridoxal phosphate-dependent aminotransferase [Streptantibioticus ferralitis]|uniref:Aminotransferase n=1 Tax=Streptantibioticus ferralitis TaxID=236510 RepID=A0ABT5YTU8_9ACTN|nr:pyridoxal phosphate-dependent aminotransferase [Streptantibioticus ferralitis]MDF2255025.1 pyridoxal phosphate-dependent aminotransferase [Streptantibioticus ferralitis]
MTVKSDTTTAQHVVDALAADELSTLLAHVADPEQRLALYQEYHPKTVNLATAENVLLYDSLKEKVFKQLGVLPENGIRYTRAYGTDQLRQETARMLSRAFHVDVDWRDVFGTAGVSGALECLAFALKEGGALKSGDGVLLPAPFWQGFKWCFQQRPGLVCVPAPVSPEGDPPFTLTLKNLQDAYAAQPVPPKLLVLTNPHNPLGVNYDKALLESIYSWALERDPQMHIISDEMYAHSQIAGATPSFTSALALDAYKKPGNSDRIHVVWGFAKDFGLSGFRAGVVISRSPVVHEAMGGTSSRETLSWFSPFDSLKHFVIGKLLESRGHDSEPYTATLMKEYGKTLTANFAGVRAALQEAGLPYVYREKANPAQFFLLDLRNYLPYFNQPPVDLLDCLRERFPEPRRFHDCLPESERRRLPIVFRDIPPAEELLRWYIAERTGVQLLPGTTLSCPEPGYFRLCFTAYARETVTKAVKLIGEALGQLLSHAPKIGWQPTADATV